MKLIKKTYDSTIEYHCDNILLYRYSKNDSGVKWWCEYDKNGNEIHYKSSNEYEKWMQYKNNKMVYFKDSNNHIWHDKKPEIVDLKDIKPFEFN